MNQPTIAYLAPEIPSLSGTFVMNEIFEWQKQGFSVLPYSVHRPVQVSDDKQSKQLQSITRYLYEQPLLKGFADILHLLVRHPYHFIRSLILVTADSFKLLKKPAESAKVWYQWFRAADLAKELKTHHVSHLHIHFAHVPTQIGMYASAMAGISYTFTGHANDLFENGRLLKEKINRSAGMITVSDYNRNWMAEKGLPVAKVSVVHCGIATDQYDYSIKGLPENKPIKIGSLGRLVEKKGMDVLIRAIGLQKQKGYHPVVEIAGDGPEKSALTQLVTDLGLNDSIRFIGSLNHQDVRGWLQSLDVFVLASKPDRAGDQDGIPVVLMEAMATGIPVVSTYLSGIPELIKHRDNGFLAEPGSSTGLAAELNTILDNQELLQSATLKARNTILTDFNLEKSINKLQAIFFGDKYGNI